MFEYLHNLLTLKKKDKLKTLLQLFFLKVKYVFFLLLLLLLFYF